MEIVPETVQAVWSWASQEQYQKWALGYNTTLERLGYATPARVAALLAEHFPAEARLLELGAGTGLVGDALLAMGSPLRLLGTDLSRAMLEQMTSTVYHQRQVLDATQPLPFPADSFDGVVGAGLLEYVVDPGRLLANILAVLAPGGRVVLSFAPAREKDVEQLETDQLLLGHHPQAVARHLAAHALVSVHEELVPAYWNRGVQILHHLVVARRQEG